MLEIEGYDYGLMPLCITRCVCAHDQRDWAQWARREREREREWEPVFEHGPEMDIGCCTYMHRMSPLAAVTVATARNEPILKNLIYELCCNLKCTDVNEVYLLWPPQRMKLFHIYSSHRLQLYAADELTMNEWKSEMIRRTGSGQIKSKGQFLLWISSTTSTSIRFSFGLILLQPLPRASLRNSNANQTMIKHTVHDAHHIGAQKQRQHVILEFMLHSNLQYEIITDIYVIIIK